MSLSKKIVKRVLTGALSRCLDSLDSKVLPSARKSLTGGLRQ